MISLTIRQRITPNRFTTIHHHLTPSQYLKPFCVRPSSSLKPKMADQEETHNKTQLNDDEESSKLGVKESNPTQSPPPPPEKPLPGDCCGSGCVRCVWDVYYEELEEYDRLYNKPTNNSKAS